MRQEERLSLILERLSQTGSVGVSGVAAELGVSTASVRRDLQLLEEQHLLSRTHGGAVANATVYELPLRYRSGSHKDEKRRIAAMAAERVDDSIATVGMTGGTTTTEVARRLIDRLGLTVVTNALNIASELALRPTVKLIVTGGTARSESYELVGPLAESTLVDLNLDIVVVGVDGISVDCRPHHLSRGRGGHQPRHDRQGPPGDRRGRRLQDRQARAGAHLRHRAGRRTDHRRERRRRRGGAPRGGRRDGDLGLTAL